MLLPPLPPDTCIEWIIPAVQKVNNEKPCKVYIVQPCEGKPFISHDEKYANRKEAIKTQQNLK